MLFCLRTGVQARRSGPSVLRIYIPPRNVTERRRPWVCQHIGPWTARRREPCSLQRLYVYAVNNVADNHCKEKRHAEIRLSGNCLGGVVIKVGTPKKCAFQQAALVCKTPVCLQVGQQHAVAEHFCKSRNIPCSGRATGNARDAVWAASWRSPLVVSSIECLHQRTANVWRRSLPHSRHQVLHGQIMDV